MEGRRLPSPPLSAHLFQQQQQQQSLSPAQSFDDVEPLFSPPHAPFQPTEPSPWRRDEHARFVQALEAVGASGDAAWAQIAAFVGSRSVGEARRHGQQYLAQLMRPPPTRTPLRPGAFDWVLDGLSDAETPTGGYPSQNDPGNALPSLSAAVKPPRKAAAPAEGPLQQPTQPRRTGGRRPKVWTFQEDKAFETALAGWTSGRPYPWTKIAAALPGKSAKDVRSRYEKLLGDVSSIEGAAFSALSLGGDAAAADAFRQRPPPIDVAPGRAASARLGLLSPTLFDLLDAPDDVKREPEAPAAAEGLAKAAAAAATPVAWREFLADDAFKFDEARAPETPAVGATQDASVTE